MSEWWVERLTNWTRVLSTVSLDQAQKADRKFKVLFTPRRPRRWRAAPHPAAAAPERPAARQSAGERDVGWGWTGAPAGGRGRGPVNLGALPRPSRGGAPLGSPGGAAAG